MSVSTKEEKIKFLKRVEQPNTMQVVSGLLTEFGNELDYKELITKNAHKTGIVSEQELEEFGRQLYELWYQEVCDIASGKVVFGDKALDDAKKILANPDYSSENIAREGFYNIIHHAKFVSLQNFSGFLLDRSQGISEFFLHVNTRRMMRKDKHKNRDIECRLYLNVEAKNITSVASQLFKSCVEQDVALYMKFTSYDLRSDTLLIYSTYADAPKYVDIINNMRKESPELFKNAHKLNPFLGKIDGYIGFGEEPKCSGHESFTSIRAKALNEIGEEMQSLEDGKLLPKSDSKPSIGERIVGVFKNIKDQIVHAPETVGDKPKDKLIEITKTKFDECNISITYPCLNASTVKDLGLGAGSSEEHLPF